jgi:hypothetical protein
MSTARPEESVLYGVVELLVGHEVLPTRWMAGSTFAACPELPQAVTPPRMTAASASTRKDLITLALYQGACAPLVAGA